jgi:hypothetical protein
MKPKEPDPKGSGFTAKLLSTFVSNFFQSFFRTIAFVGYFAFSLSAFVSNPKAIYLFEVPLSLVGLWLLLYHFDLVSEAAKRHLRW